MIIWGSRGLTLNSGQPGRFHCPGCAGDRAYQKKKLQRFFTLYFIPLIPLNVVQEWVECQTCKKQYVVGVLSRNPQAEEEARRRQINQDFRTILVHFARHAGRRDAGFLQTLVGVFAAFDGGTVTADQLRDDLNQPDRADVNLETGRIREFLTEQGREKLVKACLAAATGDGQLTDAKRAALGALGASLGMTDTHLRGILAEWTPAPA